MTTPRGSGRRQACTSADAKARLHDAEAFLDTAEAATDPDVKATNAIHAAIAAADAICCFALRERSADAIHAAAIDPLRTVDAQLAGILARLLSRKQQAAYENARRQRQRRRHLHPAGHHTRRRRPPPGPDRLSSTGADSTSASGKPRRARLGSSG